jgi:hypothetical protein
VIAGYHAEEPDRADATDEQLTVSLVGDTGVIPSKAELVRIGDMFMEEVDKIVHALTLEKEDPKCFKR